MKTLRRIITPLLIIPISLIILNILFPYKWAKEVEYLYLLFGIPIMAFNYWAWFEPIIIEKLLFMKQ